MVNRTFRLAARPQGAPKPTDWSYAEEPVPEPGPGEFRVKLAYLSLDPAMRGWMNEGRSYVPPVGLGEVMRALGTGRIDASNHPDHAVGDAVVGVFGVQDLAISDGRGVTRVDEPRPVYLGTLGMTGFTAYFGMLDIGRPQPGQTVVVSGAAGAVGMVAGQIGKILGCRVVGIAGGPEKCRFLTEELGFDAAVDYRSPTFGDALRAATPAGVDVYFDNVGGDVLDAVLTRLARGARVVICGAISQYNAEARPKGPSNYLSLLVNRASMQGMVVFDYAARYPEALAALSGWMAEGKLQSREQVVSGLETFPDRLGMLFRGENLGKLVLQV
ncbi:MAG: NADP-dependent oxidoreductase [Alphaproteobacteria bacterium]|nr:NADP-dependent oxidoreductase [Alphaproteobacteria bacterium]MCB9697166.1 NADP-dependent oxidoreductase [Alphaproteobacteria bacterium]